MLNKFIDKRN